MIRWPFLNVCMMPGITNSNFVGVFGRNGSGFEKLFLKPGRHRLAAQQHLVAARLKDSTTQIFAGGVDASCQDIDNCPEKHRSVSQQNPNQSRSRKRTATV